MFLDKYKVLKVLRSSENISCYLGERNGEVGAEYVLINEISKRTLIDVYIKDIVGLTSAEAPDFVESFSRNSKYYVVFRYAKGDSLQKMLEKEKTTFDLRFSLIVNIIHKMVGVGSLPNAIKSNLLQWENIIYTDNVLFWNYRFYLEEGEVSSDAYMFQELAKLIKKICTEKEIAKHPKLGIVVDKSEKNLYRTFGEVAKDLEDVEEAMDVEKNTMVIVEEKKAKAKSTLAQVTTVVVICVVIFMAFSALQSRKEAATVYSPIENIGAVALEEKPIASQNDVYIGYEEFEEELEVVEEVVEEPEVVEEVVEEPEVMEEVAEEPEVVEEIAEEPEVVEEIAEEVEVVEEVAEEVEVVEEATGEPAEVVYEATTHVVQTGESLWDIVKAYYENSRYVAGVAEVNGLESPYILNPGMELILPAVTTEGKFLD